MTQMINKALIIEDDEDYRILLVRKLQRAFPDIDIVQLDPLHDPLLDETYPWFEIDFILLDYNLGIEVTGLDWYKQFDKGVLPATILLTAKGSEEVAVRAIKLGIDDYIAKEKFDDAKLVESIQRCVAEKADERRKRADLTDQTNVFNKAHFINRLKLITDEKNTSDHLFLINPEAYEEIGKQCGITHQDQYIRYIADRIYQYLNAKDIKHNIFIFREEYIAVILEIKSYKKLLTTLCKLFETDKYEIDQLKYGCTVNVGVISPQSLDIKELEKSDFELLSIAMVLCNTLKSEQEQHVCNYGEVNLNKLDLVTELSSISDTLHTVDIENAIKDGRVSANYQPWVSIFSQEEKELKEIYDVRIELIDTRGIAVSQNMLLKLLDDAYAKKTVDKWVLRTAAASLVEIYDANKGSNIKLAVKITISSLSEPDFIPWLRELLIEVNLPNDYLLLEIDAGQFTRNPAVFQKLFDTVAVEFNIRFILSGVHDADTYFAARKLHRFDYIKLNITHLCSGGNRWLLSKMVEDIKSDEVNIVAINIADAAKLSLASEFNIDFMHGYLIGKPVLDIISDNTGDFYCVI